MHQVSTTHTRQGTTTYKRRQRNSLLEQETPSKPARLSAAEIRRLWGFVIFMERFFVFCFLFCFDLVLMRMQVLRSPANDEIKTTNRKAVNICKAKALLV